jgi:hypothetical protein
MESDEQAGIVLAENLIHDCTFITRYGLCCPSLVEGMETDSHSCHCPPDMLLGEGGEKEEGERERL